MKSWTETTKSKWKTSMGLNLIQFLRQIRKNFSLNTKDRKKQIKSSKIKRKNGPNHAITFNKQLSRFLMMLRQKARSLRKIRKVLVKTMNYSSFWVSAATTKAVISTKARWKDSSKGSMLTTWTGKISVLLKSSNFSTSGLSQSWSETSLQRLVVSSTWCRGFSTRKKSRYSLVSVASSRGSQSCGISLTQLNSLSSQELLRSQFQEWQLCSLESCQSLLLSF